jgi:hypothetical protein
VHHSTVPTKRDSLEISEALNLQLCNPATCNIVPVEISRYHREIPFQEINSGETRENPARLPGEEIQKTLDTLSYYSV